MRHRSPSKFVSSCLLVLAAEFAVAQEPAPAPAEQPKPSEAPAAEAQRAPEQVVVIEAGTVHPVASPAISNGIVVTRGERIVAVGKKGEVEIPPNAVVHSFPTGHVYPGLVDASTDAFTDQAMRTQAALDAGASLALDLHLRHSRDDELVQFGITTAYVAVRSQGAMARPPVQLPVNLPFPLPELQGTPQDA